MQPTKALLEAATTAVGGDVPSLAAATAMHMHLIMADFVSDKNTDFTALTPATFTGGAAKNMGTGAQPVGWDPLRARYVISLLVPAGGLRWEATAGTDLPQTIYGVVLTDTADAVTWASAKKVPPVPINAIGDFVEFDESELVFTDPILS